MKNPGDWTFAKVAKAANPSPFNITATYSLTEQPFVLWEWPTIYKTGKTTGTTINPDVLGNQTNYCYDWFVPNQPAPTPPANRVVLCQVQYPPTFTVAGGDSGGPAWGQYGFEVVAGQAYLIGIVVGGGPGSPGTVVSPANSLSWDFGYDATGGFVVYYTCVGVGFC